MAFREVSVTEIREVLRLWLRGEGLGSRRSSWRTARRFAYVGRCDRRVGGGVGVLRGVFKVMIPDNRPPATSTVA